MTSALSETLAEADEREVSTLADLDLLGTQAKAAFAARAGEKTANPSRLYLFETHPQKDVLERVVEIMDRLALDGEWKAAEVEGGRAWFRRGMPPQPAEELWIEVHSERLGVLSATEAMIPSAAEIRGMGRSKSSAVKGFDVVQDLGSLRVPLALRLGGRAIENALSGSAAARAESPNYGRQISRDLFAALAGGIDDLTFTYHLSDGTMRFSGEGDFSEDLSEVARTLLQPRPLDLGYLSQRRLPEVGDTWALSLSDFGRGFDRVLALFPAEIETATRLGLNVASFASGQSLEKDLFPAIGPTLIYSKIPKGSALPDGWTLAVQIDPARRSSLQAFFEGLARMGRIAPGRAEGLPRSLRLWSMKGENSRTIIALANDTLAFSSELRSALRFALPDTDDEHRRSFRERIAKIQPAGRVVLFRRLDETARSWGWGDAAPEDTASDVTEERPGTGHRWVGRLAGALSRHLGVGESVCAVDADKMRCRGITHLR